MSWGRKALRAILRDCAQEIKACGPRAEMYNQHQEDGRPHPIGVHGMNFGSMQWHLGLAAGIQWAQMRMEWALMGSRPSGETYPDVPPEQPAENGKPATDWPDRAVYGCGGDPIDDDLADELRRSEEDRILQLFADTRGQHEGDRGHILRFTKALIAHERSKPANVGANRAAVGGPVERPVGRL